MTLLSEIVDWSWVLSWSCRFWSYLHHKSQNWHKNRKLFSFHWSTKHDTQQSSTNSTTFI